MLTKVEKCTRLGCSNVMADENLAIGGICPQCRREFIKINQLRETSVREWKQRFKEFKKTATVRNDQNITVEDFLNSGAMR